MARKRAEKGTRRADNERRVLKAQRLAVAATHDERTKHIVPMRGMFSAFENPRMPNGKVAGRKWGYTGNIAKGLHQKGRVYV